MTDEKVRGIRIYFWAYTSRYTLYLQDKSGDEDWHVYAVDLDAGETRDLTPTDGVQAQNQVSRRLIDSLNDVDEHGIQQICATVRENVGRLGHEGKLQALDALSAREARFRHLSLMSIP